MKPNLKDKLIDTYLSKPILADIILIAIMLIVEHFGKMLMIKHNIHLIQALDMQKGFSYLSTLIGTIVSLTGFMVAALTIMITIKASLKARGFNDSENALEYIFTTNRYHEIVRVFTHTIVELITLLILSYLIWFLALNINDLVMAKFMFYITFAMSTSIIRSIFIFFIILKLENLKRQKKLSESNEDKQTRLLEEISNKLSNK